jgi:alpha-L-fucosidase
MTSVGRGSNLLLNIPPDRRGQIHEIDVKNLLEWRKLLNERFANNLALHKKVRTSEAFNKKQESHNLTDGENKTYWAASKTTCDIEVDLEKTETINFVEAKETTIGYKRIVKIPTTKASRIRLRITDAKAEVILTELKAF